MNSTPGWKGSSALPNCIFWAQFSCTDFDLLNPKASYPTNQPTNQPASQPASQPSKQPSRANGEAAGEEGKDGWWWWGERGWQEAKTTIWILNWTAFCATYARELDQPPVEWSADRRTWADLLPTCRGWSCCFFGFTRNPNWRGDGVGLKLRLSLTVNCAQLPTHCNSSCLATYRAGPKAKAYRKSWPRIGVGPETATWLPAVPASTQFQLPISNLWLSSVARIGGWTPQAKEKSDIAKGCARLAVTALYSI